MASSTTSPSPSHGQRQHCHASNKDDSESESNQPYSVTITTEKVEQRDHGYQQRRRWRRGSGGGDLGSSPGAMLTPLFLMVLMCAMSAAAHSGNKDWSAVREHSVPPNSDGGTSVEALQKEGTVQCQTTGKDDELCFMGGEKTTMTATEREVTQDGKTQHVDRDALMDKTRQVGGEDDDSDFILDFDDLDRQQTEKTEVAQKEANVELREEDSSLRDDFMAPPSSAAVAEAFEDAFRAKRKLMEEQRAKNEGEVIVVAAVDGTLVGICKSTGRTLWKRTSLEQHHQGGDDSTPPPESNPRTDGNQSKREEEALFLPLLSTSTTVASSSPEGERVRTAAIPSLDGKVYLTVRRDPTGSSGEGGSDDQEGTLPEEVTATALVRDLVSNTPFVDRQGRFFVGSRHATAAALDRNTGEVLRLVSAENFLRSTTGTASPESDDTLKSIEGRDVVWVGRVDYSIKVYDRSRDDVDVEFRTSEVLGVEDMLQGRDPHYQVLGQDDDLHASRRQRPLMLPPGEQETTGSMAKDVDTLKSLSPNTWLGQETASASENALLVATPNGKVALCDPGTGYISWVANETFDTPAAFAVESSGATVRVEMVPDVPSGESEEHISRELEKHVADREKGIAGEMDGEEQHGAGQVETIVGALRSGELFALPVGRSKRSAGPLFAGLLPSPEDSHAASSWQPSAGSLAVSPGGNHLFPRYSRGPCSPEDDPRCMIGKAPGWKYEMPDYVLVPLESQFKQPSLGDVAATVERLWTLLSPWLPTIVAALVIIFFEWSRREKNNRNDRATAADTQIPDTNGNTVRFDTSSHTESLDPAGGVIQVSNEVLGYGGHGTVVYRGALDGRNVAVKRMLKAYHASADREMSLLIESDGHPHVVRYFLKEVRGDFVYLALELCDMTLQDLITVVGKHSNSFGEKDEKEREAEKAAACRSALLQVGQGVRHLHSLRIVHRDLKPQNILLAYNSSNKGGARNATMNGSQEVRRPRDSNDVFGAFLEGVYVAKISDMGLGKQLGGQSSFGFSTLGNGMNEANGGVHAGSSSFVGGGPGSVGWQAPEVMAQRMSPDTVLSRRNTGDPSDVSSSSSSSPFEMAMGTRTSRSVDIFSLGCIFYSFLKPGYHPFGEWYEREANIMKNQPMLDPAGISPDALDLVISMIHRDPQCRPTAAEVCVHPFFWTPPQRMSFLCEFSDRIEVEFTNCEERDDGSVSPFIAVESGAVEVVGTSWDLKLNADLLKNVAKFRTYDTTSVRDCLRIIRNKHHHYDELPPKVKQQMGSNPEGLLRYFEGTFPRLLLHCHQVCRNVMAPDDPFLVKFGVSLSKKEQARRQRSSRSSSSSREEAAARAAASMSMQKTSATPLQPLQEQEQEPQQTQTKETVRSATPVPPTNESMEPEGKPPAKPESVSLSSKSEKIPGENPSAATLKAADSMSSPSPLLCGVVEEAKPSSAEEQALSPQQPQEPSQRPEKAEKPAPPATPSLDGLVVWEGSSAARTFQCRGWMRSHEDWTTRVPTAKRDATLAKCAEDAKFRTRLCNHWDESLGTFCPMRKKNKCAFAHGPVELRVKEGKRHRWGKLVDKNGNSSNAKASGGEDTYGAARSIESMRKEEGKWNASSENKGRNNQNRSKQTSGGSKKK